MTKFNQRRFSVSAPITDAYAENWERTFGKKTIEPRGMSQDEAAMRRAAVGLPMIAVARVEIEKWIQRLEQIDLPKFRGALIDQYPEILVTDRATREMARSVVESMKLILKADRITDALARK